MAIHKAQDTKSSGDPPTVKGKRGRPPKLSKNSQTSTAKLPGKKTNMAISNIDGAGDSTIKKEAVTPAVSPFAGMSYILNNDGSLTPIAPNIPPSAPVSVVAASTDVHSMVLPTSTPEVCQPANHQQFTNSFVPLCIPQGNTTTVNTPPISTAPQFIDATGPVSSSTTSGVATPTQQPAFGGIGMGNQFQNNLQGLGDVARQRPQTPIHPEMAFPGLHTNNATPVQPPAQAQQATGHQATPLQGMQFPGLNNANQNLNSLNSVFPEANCQTAYTPQAISASIQQSMAAHVNAGRNAALSPFMLAGATLDYSVKSKIWSKDFIDLSYMVVKKDANAGMNLVFNPSAESPFALAPPKSKLPRNILEWVMWFTTYASVYCAKYSEEASEMFTYLRDIVDMFQLNPNTFAWRQYDLAFRELKKSANFIQWHMTMDHLKSQALTPVRNFTASQLLGFGDQNNRGGRGRGAGNRGRGKKLCYDYNNRSCTRQNCGYAHICISCKGSHPQSTCRNKEASSDSRGTQKK